MALVSFIVVFVWEAFGLWSYPLQHTAHPLECIMEMKFLLLLCVCGLSFFFFKRDNLCFPPRWCVQMGVQVKKKKKKKVRGSRFKVRSGWNL